MKFTNSFIVAVATFNLALGAPVAEQKSRAVVAKDAVKRAAANNPYFARDEVAEAKRNTGSVTPKTLRSVLNLIGKRSSGRSDKRYGYGHTPYPGSVENLDKRHTPNPGSVENLDKRYGYGHTPYPGSVESLDKRYGYGHTPYPGSVEDLNKE
jgi:hypothetical protein